MRTPLSKSGCKPVYCFFLTSGLASVVSTSEEGDSTEVGMIGSEGLVGCLNLLGPAADPTDCFMQSDGEGWRIPLQDLRSFFQSEPDFRQRALEYAQYSSFVLSIVARCNRLHDSEPRIARWLAMAKNRLLGSDLPFTHDILALLLGSSRPTVSLVMKAFEHKGLLEQTRGCISILKPKELSDSACACLRNIEDMTSLLYQKTP